MKIALVGGGTVGHIAPSQSLIQSLKEKDSKIKYFYVAADQDLDRSFLKLDNKVDQYFLPVAKLRRYFDLQNFTDFFNFTKAFFKSFKILKNQKPDLVFSKGGYVSVPFCLAARILNIPIILHESDSSLGLANKLILPLAKQIWLSHPNCLRKRFISKSYVLKLPIKKSLLDPSGNFEYSEYLDPNLKNLLVIGGSLGSQNINYFIESNKKKITEKYNIIQILGSKNFKKEMKPHLKYVPLKFVDDLGPLYRITDLCITRGGAGTLAELEALKIPSLIIPLTKQGSRGDQLLNAEYFVERNKFGEILMESSLTFKKFESTIKNIPDRTSVSNFKNQEKIVNKLYELVSKATANPK